MLQASAVCSLQFAVCSLQLAAGVDKVRCNVAGRRSQVAGGKTGPGASRSNGVVGRRPLIVVPELARIHATRRTHAAPLLAAPGLT